MLGNRGEEGRKEGMVQEGERETGWVGVLREREVLVCEREGEMKGRRRWDGGFGGTEKNGKREEEEKENGKGRKYGR